MSQLTCGHMQHMYSWWWVRFSPETCRVKAIAKNKNAIVASCWTYFTYYKAWCTEPQILNTFCVQLLFFLIVPFVWKCGKILCSGAGHRWQYGTCALHAGYLRLLIHTLRLCNTLCFPTAAIVARTRLIASLYVHCLSFCFNYNYVIVDMFVVE